MSLRKTTAAIVLAFAVLVPATARCVGSTAPADYPKASPFSCTTLSGERLAYESLAGGRPYLVLVFFGVNCKPCQKEIAQLNELVRNRAFREQAGVYAVNADGYPAGKLAAELKRREITVDFPVIPDDNQAITNLYVEGVVPLTVVIDRDGRILLSVVGARPESVRKIEKLILAGKETASP